MAHRLPRELSGGQQQRVAVARALAARPSLLLLDEPFGALDRALRFDLQVEMLRLQKTLGITTLIVTHDQEEAQSLASRLVLMNKGSVEQIDTPMAVYDRPKTLFVNSFIGQANQLAGTVSVARGERPLEPVLAIDGTPRAAAPPDFIVGSPVVVTFRPEDVASSRGRRETALPRHASTVAVPLGPTLVHDLAPRRRHGDPRHARCAGPTRHSAPRESSVFAEIDTSQVSRLPGRAGRLLAVTKPSTRGEHMNDFSITRRSSAARRRCGRVRPCFRFAARAAGGSLVAATFPGNWEDAYRTVLTPMVSRGRLST